MPETFKNPTLWSGWLVESSPADVGEKRPLHWREATADPKTGATVDGLRAEISWPGGNPPAKADYVLCGIGDRVIASISVHQGEMTIRATRGVRCWYWAAAAPAATDASGQPPERAASRFGWQILGGLASAPDSIRRDERWLDGRARRLELPLDLRESAGKISGALVFVDRITGWAIGNEIEQTQEASANRR